MAELEIEYASTEAFEAAVGEEFRPLYSDQGGKMRLTGVKGFKTPADVQAALAARDNEKAEHAKTKEALGVWGDLKHDEVMAKLDRLPELEAAAKGPLDQAKIDEIVAGRVDGTIASRLAPVERENSKLKQQVEKLAEENAKHVTANRDRQIGDEIRAAAGPEGAKLRESAIGDALMHRGLFEVREDDGAVVTKDGVGVTPGLDPAAWLSEVEQAGTKSHWWDAPEGGGARGGGPGAGGPNPWTGGNWNVTAQGAYIKKHGLEKATRMAKAAGSHIGATSPPAKN